MKKIIKEIFNDNPILDSEIIGLPDIGKRLDGKQFSKKIRIIANAINFVSKGTKEMEKTIMHDFPKYSFVSGNPLKFKPFKHSINAMKKSIKSKNIYEYPNSSGDEKDREIIIKYLIKEGFINSNPYKNSKLIGNGLSTDNVAFTISTTQAFNLVLDIILKPYDVIIIPGPNYSLFTFSAERINSSVEIIDLREEDHWLINPELLANKIDEINKRLEKKYKTNKNLSYVPRVKAFLNCNPSNPTGKVLSNKNIDILKQLSKIANEKEIFIIDDMVYRDICYDRKNIAKPMATLPENFENTLTLLGLSKSYGLASIRAGIVVADEIVIRELRNKIFQQMDSLPNIQISALTGAFNSRERRYKYYERYFSKIRKEYIYRYDIILTLINGIDFVKNKKNKTKIKRLVSKVVPDNDCYKILKNGIAGLKLVNNMEPEAGFFTLVDFTELKGKKYDYIIINNDLDLLEFFYYSMRVKFLIGSSFSFPSNDKLVGRITFALEPLELVKSFYAIYKATLLLK